MYIIFDYCCFSTDTNWYLKVMVFTNWYSSKGRRRSEWIGWNYVTIRTLIFEMDTFFFCLSQVFCLSHGNVLQMYKVWACITSLKHLHLVVCLLVFIIILIPNYYDLALQILMQLSCCILFLPSVWLVKSQIVELLKSGVLPCQFFLWHCCGLAPASSQAPWSCSLTPPPSGLGRELEG